MSSDFPIIPQRSSATDATQAQLALANPTTAAATLAQIAQDFPQLRGGVAAHPNAYPGLLDCS